LTYFIKKCILELKQLFTITMLTELEMKAVSLGFGICCRFNTIPFEWSNRKLSIKVYNFRARIWNAMMWFFILLTLGIRIFLAPSVFGGGDVNRAIPNGLLLIASSQMVVGKLLYNTRYGRAVLLRLVNESLHMNSAWG